MTDKDLIKKLNSLKNINPDSSWVAGNRDLLLSQISNSGATELSSWQGFIINVSSFLKASAHPAYALGVFVLLLIGGSLFSHQMFSSAKPNDSLYIARIISEKARLNTMFDSQERNKLAVQFATSHAQDISATLATIDITDESNRDQVAKLNDSFNKELETAKEKISYLNNKANKVSRNSNIETNSVSNASDTVSIANDLIANSGVQVFEAPSEKVEPVAISPATNTLMATSTQEVTAESPVEVQADSILEEAKQLFENKDYGRAADKLKEVDEIIKQ